VATNNKNPPLLTEAVAAFVQHHTSMNVAARDAQNRPAIARGLGCRVSDDRLRITVFLSTSHSAHVLQCLRENGVIAMAVTRPKTHETYQFKGRVLDIAPVSDDDGAAMAAYRDSFVEELGNVGYRPEFTGTLLAGGEDSVAVVFEPLAMFNQTPGPKAGEKLGERA
jgi:hypothetical protein